MPDMVLVVSYKSKARYSVLGKPPCLKAPRKLSTKCSAIYWLRGLQGLPFWPTVGDAIKCSTHQVGWAKQFIGDGGCPMKPWVIEHICSEDMMWVKQKNSAFATLVAQNLADLKIWHLILSRYPTEDQIQEANQWKWYLRNLSRIK